MRDWLQFGGMSFVMPVVMTLLYVVGAEWCSWSAVSRWDFPGGDARSWRNAESLPGRIAAVLAIYR
jgi:hypothetical protein